MANLAKSAIAFKERYESDGLNGKRYVYREVNLTLSGQGTVANKITASVLELDKIKGASSFVQSDNSELVSAGPSYDGSQLLLGDGSSNAPQDLTGVFSGTVWGTREL